MSDTQSFPFAARLLHTGQYAALLPDLAECELDKAQVVKLTHPVLDPLSRSLSLAWNPRLLEVRPKAQEVIAYFMQQFAVRFS